MVLDRQGGPNWFKNWCLAPVIVDPEADEVYMTPIYYAMAHFSKYIRPGAKRIDFTNNSELQVTAVKNPDSAIVIIILNESEESQKIELDLEDKKTKFSISSQAIQTVIIPTT
jgi:glucosylceramidase